MKFRTKEEKVEAWISKKPDWESYFVWCPLRVEGNIVWLEKIKRKRTISCGYPFGGTFRDHFLRREIK